MRTQAGMTLLALAAAIGGPHAALARSSPDARAEPARLASALRIATTELRRQQAQIDALKQRVAEEDAAIAALLHPAAPVAPTAAPAHGDEPAAPPPAVGTASTKEGPVPAAASAVPAATSFHLAAFFNESTIHQTADGAPVPAEGMGFNIKRLYFGVDHQFDPVFSASVLADVRNVLGSTTTSAGGAANGAATASPGARVFLVKNAYLQARLAPALTLRLGAAPLPWIGYIESRYGYRQIENTLVDRLKLGNTADWGVHVLGKLADGAISYQLSAVDGGGFGDVRITRHVDFEGRIAAEYAGFFAAAGGYAGHLGKAVNSTGAFAPVHHTARRADLALGYKDRRLTLGGEVYYARDYNSVNSPTEDSSLGLSVFASLKLAPKWSVFGRYDRVRAIARLDAPSTVHDHYANLGVQWEPVQIVDLALVAKREAVANGALATQNGTIGASPGASGAYDEIGLFGQFRF
ncbi:MAG: hypothetical protein KGK11_00310 [Sphingomonadales bacterium]|nr:hypothetical protein [Sphingomonadales bacterium]